MPMWSRGQEKGEREKKIKTGYMQYEDGQSELVLAGTPSVCVKGDDKNTQFQGLCFLVSHKSFCSYTLKQWKTE